MKVLVLGANGNTGKLVVNQLLANQVKTRILIRKNAIILDEILTNPFLEVIRDSISDMDCNRIDDLIKDCDVVISCLGHNLSFKGMYGKPRNLVAKAIQSIDEAAKRSNKENLKLILMSTTAYTNYTFGEKNSFGEKLILSIFKFLLPPHQDNMKAANFLVKKIGKDDAIRWVAVRPDTLINDNNVSPYVIMESPNRSPVFNAGKTSRINVSHFMASLVLDEALWNQWEFKTPVLYNKNI